MVKRTKAEKDNALEKYQEMLSSMRQIVKGRNEWKDGTVEALTKLRLLHEEGRKVNAPVQVVDIVEAESNQAGCGAGGEGAAVANVTRFG